MNHEFRRRVGFVFQNPEVQLFNPTVRDEIAFAPLQLGWPAEQIRDEVERMVDRMQLGPVVERPTFRLSMGEKKRVAIASVLILDPEVILLDEPTAGLDPRSQSGIIDLLEEWQGSGRTVVLATHDLGVIEEIADRCLIFQEGRLVADRPPGEIVADLDLLTRTGLVHSHRHSHRSGVTTPTRTSIATSTAGRDGSPAALAGGGRDYDRSRARHRRVGDPVAGGLGDGNLIYTVALSSVGTQTADGVIVTPALLFPAGVTLDLVTAATGTWDGSTWSDADSASGDDATLAFTLTVGLATSGGTDVVGLSAAVTAAPRSCRRARRRRRGDVCGRGYFLRRFRERRRLPPGRSPSAAAEPQPADQAVDCTPHGRPTPVFPLALVGSRLAGDRTCRPTPRLTAGPASSFSATSA